MVVMLSRLESRNKYDFQSPLPSRRYFVLTYHFYGTNSYSTNVLHKYGNLVMPNLEDRKIRNTHSGFLIEKQFSRYNAPSIKEWNALMDQIEKDLNSIVSQH